MGKKLLALLPAAFCSVGVADLAQAGPCDLVDAQYRSGEIVLSFSDNENGETDLQIITPHAKFSGFIEAISGYGYTAYRVWEGDSPQPKGDAVAAGTIYGLGPSGPRKTVREEGAWGSLPAPQALLLSDLGRDIFYYLRDHGREGDATHPSDLFVFQKCLKK